MAFKFLSGLKNISSTSDALDTLGRLVDYVKFRPLETEGLSVSYDSMSVRDLGINAGAVKLVKFFQNVAKSKDPSATMYVQLIKQYFLNAYDWSDTNQEGYAEFESDALWFCAEMEDYLLKLSQDETKKSKKNTSSEMIMRRIEKYTT